jgi:hypothetical protein
MKPTVSHPVNQILPILVVVVLLLSACQALPSFSGGQQPGENPLPGETPGAPGGETLTLATVEEVSIQMLESLPVQVKVVVKGYLNNSCTFIDRIVTERKDATFQITIFAKRASDQVCAQAVYPYEEQIALDVLGLLAGNYSVDVNGTQSQFVLLADNLPIGERASLSGMVWHDLCALAVDERGTPIQPTAGCIKLDESTYEGNGALEAGEPGIAGVLVNLGLGVCPAVGSASAATNSDGIFTFADLTPGTYCLSIDPLEGQNAAALIPGGWTAPARAAEVATFTITLQAGENKNGMNFGWDYQFKPEPPVLPTPAPTATTAPTPTPTARPTPCDWAQFVKDITVSDGTGFSPGSKFTKTWRIKNIGTCTWTNGYNLVFASGDQMGAPSVVALPGTVRPGETIDVSVNLTAPTKVGKYRGYWQLRNADGVLFGLGSDAKDRFYVDIQVKEINRSPVFSFTEDYCAAAWQSAAGTLACPGSTDSETGFVIRLNNPALENRNEDEPALWLHPNHNNDSWIQGTYPAFKVKEGDHFQAWVGCLDGSDGCDVLFELGYMKPNGRYKVLGSWHEVYEGKVTIIDLDLSNLAGDTVPFVLTMTTENGRPRRANGFWFVPRITRIDRNIP